ncbi:MAG TPA: hypothetical protein VH854_03470 [Thermoanaerobaculia bacterium]|nr:hypothetical protein [Thermoanaerobaculia bacterium]
MQRKLRNLTRVGAAVLVLAVAAATTTCRKDGDHSGGGTGATVCDTPCNQILVVGTDGALSCGSATISLTANNEVAWRTSAATGALQITFDAPSPFPSLRCASGMCISGPPDPNVLPPGTNSKTFGYTSYLTAPDEAKGADAGATASGAGITPTPTPGKGTSSLGHIIIQR